MKNTIPLLLVSMLALACGNEPAAPSAPEPLPAPRLEPELTTTRAPSADVAPAPAPEPAEAPPESFEPELRDGDVRLRRLIVATGVSDREPTGASDAFELGTARIYAFVEAVNETHEPVELRVTFEPERGESVGHVALEVPASARRFRTWAYTRHVYSAGRWNVVVRDADGRLIARRPFDVE